MCAYVCRTQREIYLRVAEWTFVVFSHVGSFVLLSSLLICPASESLCLQLETHADFVSTTVHVLPINQT